MKNLFKNILLCIFSFFSLNSFAAVETNFIESFYSSGKIYVVFAGVFLVLIMLLVVIIRMDLRLSKMEKEKKEIN